MNLQSSEKYMRRCFELALRSKGNVSPNPLVGAVIVHNERIIGEGRHEYFGGPHAEINALNSVKKEDVHFIKDATIYVNLEPCDHQGKTGPCSVALIKSGIKKIVVSNVDPFEEVNQKGIARLESANIKVDIGLLKQDGYEINKSFFTFHQKKRPYVILKWAQSYDFYIGKKEEQISISNKLSNTLSHKWRSELDAILIGTNTAVVDNPSLTTRNYNGKSPLRIVIDLNNRIPITHQLLADEHPTILFCHNNFNEQIPNNKEIVTVDPDEDLLAFIMDEMYHRDIQSILIEGGRKIHTSFIKSNLWDEARIITATDKILGKGIKCARLRGKRINVDFLGEDRIDYIKNTHTNLY